MLPTKKTPLSILLVKLQASNDALRMQTDRGLSPELLEEARTLAVVYEREHATMGAITAAQDHLEEVLLEELCAAKVRAAVAESRLQEIADVTLARREALETAGKGDA